MACSPAVGGGWAGPSVQQQAGHRAEPGRPGGVDPVPVRVARVQQRRPATVVIQAHSQGEVGGDELTDQPRLAQRGGGEHAGVPDLGVTGQQPGRLPRPARHAGGQERRDVRGPLPGAGVDRGLQLGPAWEAVFACDGQLGDGQRDRGRVAGRNRAGDPRERGGAARACTVAQFFGLAAKLAQIRGVGQRLGHGVSPHACGPRLSPRKRPQQGNRQAGGGLSPSRGPGSALASKSGSRG